MVFELTDANIDIYTKISVITLYYTNLTGHLCYILHKVLERNTGWEPEGLCSKPSRASSSQWVMLANTEGSLGPLVPPDGSPCGQKDRTDVLILPAQCMKSTNYSWLYSSSDSQPASPAS